MKKALVLIVVSALLFTASFGIAYMITSNVYVSEPAEDTMVMAEETLDSKVTVTISAVGDCTLGTDPAFGMGGSFPLELKNNGGDLGYFLSDVREIFESDELTIANLEGPLTSRGKRAAKKYAFRGEPDYAEIFSGSSVEAANLANNHSMDYGQEGYDDTVKHLADHCVEAFGNDIVKVMDVKGIRIGLIGTNALNAKSRDKFLENLESLKAMNPDFTVASFHWGVESSSVPNGEQVILAHRAIDNGVDLVIGHHPHVLQGVEKYKDKYIAYSLGNFCFGGNRGPADKDTAIFRQMFTFENGKLVSAKEPEIIPCLLSSVNHRNNFHPIPAADGDFDRIVNKIVTRSAGYSGVENISFIRGKY